MAITRTIYTQGDVQIKAEKPTSAHLANSCYTGADGFWLSGVQSANFTANSPQQDVNSFGFYGTIAKVQVEPSTATMEVNAVVISTGLGLRWLSGLVADAQMATPSGFDIGVSGVGRVRSGVLSSFRFETAVGALPTLALTFEGISGAYPAALAEDTSYSAVTYTVATPDTIDTIMWDPTLSNACASSVRTSWEMPIERVNCLGGAINEPTVFTRPPGTFQFVAEGIDFNLLGHIVTGIVVGPYTIAGNNFRETSRTVNMAVGEIGATFNVTSETVAMGATIIQA